MEILHGQAPVNVKLNVIIVVRNMLPATRVINHKEIRMHLQDLFYESL